MHDFTELPPAAPQAPSPRRRRRSVVFWLVVLIPLVLVGGVVSLLGLGALFILTGKEETLTAAERQCIPDIHALAECLEDYSPDPRNETVQKVRYIDRSYDIEYEYDEPEDLYEPYLYCCVTVEPKQSDAITTCTLAWQTSKMSMWGAEAEIEISERNDLFAWGDSSRFAVVMADGEPSGHLFVARNGRTVVDLILLGIYFDTGDGFGAFVSPKLEKIAAQLP